MRRRNVGSGGREEEEEGLKRASEGADGREEEAEDVQEETEDEAEGTPSTQLDGIKKEEPYDISSDPYFARYFSQTPTEVTFSKVRPSLYILLLGVSLALLVSPILSPIHSAPYHPQQIPLREGIFEPNDELLNARKLAIGQLPGCEDFVMTPDNLSFLCGSKDGWIRRMWMNETVEKYLWIGSQVLGLEWAANGDLIVCATSKGLLSVTNDKKITVLATGSKFRPFKIVDNVAAASSGRIFFSDASEKFPVEKYYLEGLEMGLNGRLLVYDPKFKLTDIVIESLAFANGVALSKDEDFVLVADTYRTRIIRYWLNGTKTGTADVFLDNLPGYPDNVNSNEDGTFWIALASRRSETLDFFQPLPLVKTALSKFPAWTWMGFAETGGWLLKVSQEGEVIESLEDSKGKIFRFLTSAREYGGTLYFSSWQGDYIGALKLS